MTNKIVETRHLVYERRDCKKDLLVHIEHSRRVKQISKYILGEMKNEEVFDYLVVFMVDVDYFRL